MALEVKGGAVGPSMTVREYMDAWLDRKERGGTVEASTIKGYRTEVKWVDRYIGDVRLSDLAIADVGTWMQDMSRRALPTPLAIAIERALGNGKGGFYEKEPKTSSSARTIPLTDYTFKVLAAIRRDRRLACMEMGVPFGDPYMLGTLGEDDRPYNPTMLSKDFTAFTKMNGFGCSFHDLRHTFATMLIAEGVDVRTVASYLGHASVSMTLDIYADVDSDAKKAAVSKIVEALGAISPEESAFPMLEEPCQPRFTSAELRAMLADAERREKAI